MNLDYVRLLQIQRDLHGIQRGRDALPAVSRTAIECLFGDAAGQTQGFTPRGLSTWAGLALAQQDAGQDPALQATALP